MKFYRWDTLDWDNPEDQTESSAHHCAPTRSQILDSHRCLLIDEYLTRIGVTEVSEWEEERGILGSGMGNGYDVTRIGIDTGDIPANYRSPLSRLFNRLNKMGIACVLPSYEYRDNGDGNTIDLANEFWLKERSDLEYATHGHDHYIFYPQKTNELTNLAMGIEAMLDDYPLMDDETLSHIEGEACDVYWEEDGYHELLVHLIEQHSHFEHGREYNPDGDRSEWDDAEDVEWDDDEYDAFAKAMLKDGSRGPIDTVRGLIDNYSAEYMIRIEHGANYWQAAGYSETAVKDIIERPMLKDKSFQKLWDICIDTADIENFIWLCEKLVEIKWSNGLGGFYAEDVADAACMVTERIEELAIAADKQEAKERGQLQLIEVGVTSK